MKQMQKLDNLLFYRLLPALWLMLLVVGAVSPSLLSAHKGQAQAGVAAIAVEAAQPLGLCHAAGTRPAGLFPGLPPVMAGTSQPGCDD